MLHRMQLVGLYSWSNQASGEQIWARFAFSCHICVHLLVVIYTVVWVFVLLIVFSFVSYSQVIGWAGWETLESSS